MSYYSYILNGSNALDVKHFKEIENLNIINWIEE